MTTQQDKFREEMLTEFQKQTDTLDHKSNEIDKHLAQVEHQLKVYLENAVGRRIDVLFEGYEIEHSHRVMLKQDTSRLRQLEGKHTA